MSAANGDWWPSWLSRALDPEWRAGNPGDITMFQEVKYTTCLILLLLIHSSTSSSFCRILPLLLPWLPLSSCRWYLPDPLHTARCSGLTTVSRSLQVQDIEILKKKKNYPTTWTMSWPCLFTKLLPNLTQRQQYFHVYKSTSYLIWTDFTNTLIWPQKVHLKVFVIYCYARNGSMLHCCKTAGLSGKLCPLDKPWHKTFLTVELE